MTQGARRAGRAAAALLLVPAAVIRLPPPKTSGNVSVEDTLARRRSVRAYADRPLSLAEVSQLLWAAQGVTGPDGKRTAPSAGALYPMEISLVAGRVTGLDAGIYRYLPAAHSLRRIAAGDRRRAVAEAALWQEWVREAPAVIVIAGVVERTAKKYDPRAPRYVDIEAGAVAQNVNLQAVALGLGTVVVGAFDDSRLAAAAALSSGERPLLVIPVGKPR
jgi:SagB-type dehydrogenase family enzyme